MTLEQGRGKRKKTLPGKEHGWKHFTRTTGGRKSMLKRSTFVGQKGEKKKRKKNTRGGKGRRPLRSGDSKGGGKNAGAGRRQKIVKLSPVVFRNQKE